MNTLNAMNTDHQPPSISSGSVIPPTPSEVCLSVQRDDAAMHGATMALSSVAKYWVLTNLFPGPVPQLPTVGGIPVSSVNGGIATIALPSLTPAPHIVAIPPPLTANKESESTKTSACVSEQCANNQVQCDMSLVSQSGQPSQIQTPSSNTSSSSSSITHPIPLALSHSHTHPHTHSHSHATHSHSHSDHSNTSNITTTASSIVAATAAAVSAAAAAGLPMTFTPQQRQQLHDQMIHHQVLSHQHQQQHSQDSTQPRTSNSHGVDEVQLQLIVGNNNVSSSGSNMEVKQEDGKLENIISIPALRSFQ